MEKSISESGNVTHKELRDYIESYVGTLIVIGYRVDKDLVRYIKGKLIGVVDEFVVIQTKVSIRMIALRYIVELKLNPEGDE